MAFLKIVALALLCMYQVSCEQEKGRQNNPRVAMNQKRDSPAIADIPWEEVMNQKEDTKKDAKKVEIADKDAKTQKDVKKQKDSKTQKDPFLKELFGGIAHAGASLVGGAAKVIGGAVSGVAQAAGGILCGGVKIVKGVFGADHNCGGGEKGGSGQAGANGQVAVAVGYQGQYLRGKSDCYGPCNGKTGMCQACGDLGYCCRAGYKGCPVGMPTETGYHTCTNYKSAPVFLQGMQGQTSCPRGYALLKDRSACENHAARYLGKPFVIEICAQFNARGCFTDTGHTYFSNCVPRRATSQQNAPVCVKTQAQPQPQPQPQAQNVQCNWVANAGGDGKAKFIGKVDRSQPNVCATECYKKSQTVNRGIKGALIVHEDLSCYCMEGMTKTVADNRYTSCVFKVILGDQKATQEEKRSAVEHFAEKDQDVVQKKK